jgi:predicted transcriptional regulator
MADEQQLNSVELAAELTIAWLGNQNVRVLAEDVPAFLRAMHGTIQELSGSNGATPAEAAEDDQASEHIPAVSVRRSLASKEHIISLIDGKPYKTLRRHLAGHGLTPEQYRERYKLKSDYPMTAPSYSEARRSMALKIGLGDKGRAAKASSRKESGSEKTAPVEPIAAAASARKPRQKGAGRGSRAGAAAAKSASPKASQQPRALRKSKKPAA